MLNTDQQLDRKLTDDEIVGIRALRQRLEAVIRDFSPDKDLRSAANACKAIGPAIGTVAALVAGHYRAAEASFTSDDAEAAIGVTLGSISHLALQTAKALYEDSLRPEEGKEQRPNVPIPEDEQAAALALQERVSPLICEEVGETLRKHLPAMQEGDGMSATLACDILLNIIATIVAQACDETERPLVEERLKDMLSSNIAVSVELDAFLNADTEGNA